MSVVHTFCHFFMFLYASRPEKEPQFKFIYFNHMNLAEKSTIHMRKTASVCLTSVHSDLMKILGDINCDFARYSREHCWTVFTKLYKTAYLSTHVIFIDDTMPLGSL